MIENVDRRALAGFFCVDAITNLSVDSPLVATGTQPGLRLISNRSGVFAVMDAPGVSRDTQVLTPDPGKWPMPSAFEVKIVDQSLRYLPRRAQISVPQPLPPASTTTPTGTPAVPPVTVPQKIFLYPATSAPVGINWAVVRVSVVRNADPAKPLQWAVVQVQITGAATQVTGVTNNLGEAVLAVPGLGPTLSSSGSGSVTETKTPATVSAMFDLGAVGQPPDWVSNPDVVIGAQLKSSPQTVQLVPGQTVFVSLTISM